MGKIRRYISSFLVILRKHGILGEREKIRYFYAGYIDVEWATSAKHNTNEFIKIYQTICEQYVEIRMHVIMRSKRIGEYISRYLMAVENSKKNAEKGVLDVFVLDDYVEVNSRLKTIMGRNIHIVNKENVNMWTYILSRFPKVEFRKYLWDYKYIDKEILLDPKKTADYLLLTSEEEEEARKKKALMGLFGSFVCASSRDLAFLDIISPGHDFSNRGSNYRNSDINNLALSANYLADQGITMVRMGRYVKDEVKFANCIDYANKYYDELMDIALMRDCKFYVGDASGINLLPMTLNIPCAYKNVVLILWDAWGSAPQNPHNLFIFKKYYSTVEKRFLSFREMMKVDKVILSSEKYGRKYAELNIELVENSAEEILDLVMEMNARIDGEWIETKEDIELQNKYQKIFKQWYEQEHYSENAMLQAKVGALFLRKNSFLLA